jgi:hypothetical protein
MTSERLPKKMKMEAGLLTVIIVKIAGPKSPTAL